MKIHKQIGIDSQCLSYVIEAMASSHRLNESVADQQLALIRLFFYLPDTLWVTPTVTRECAQIRDTEIAELHKSFINVLFGEKPLNNLQSVQSRAKALQHYHSGTNDCFILAEAEDVGHDVLLSFDTTFMKHLSIKSSAVDLVQPAEYWTKLNIPRGQRPNKVPHYTNPLSTQDWWRW